MPEYPMINVSEFNNLLEGIKNGSQSAFEKFYVKYAHMIFNVAFGYVGKMGLAEDVLNDVMLKICTNISKIKYIKSPSKWLITVVKNHCLNIINNQKRLVLSPDIFNGDNFFMAESEVMFFDLLGSLTERERMIVILKITFGFTFKEIADIMDITDSNAEKIFYRIKTKIKEQ